MELFEEYGKVDSVKMLRGVGENAPTIGLVFMPGETAAEKAIEALQGEELEGQPIKIEMSFEHIHIHHGENRRPIPPIDEEDDEVDMDENDDQPDNDYEPSEEPNWEV